LQTMEERLPLTVMGKRSNMIEEFDALELFHHG